MFNAINLRGYPIVTSTPEKKQVVHLLLVAELYITI